MCIHITIIKENKGFEKKARELNRSGWREERDGGDVMASQGSRYTHSRESQCRSLKQAATECMGVFVSDLGSSPRIDAL